MSQQALVAGYYRVSLARDNMHAPELYEHEITRYCSYKKLTLGRIYSDIDHSAFRGARRARRSRSSWPSATTTPPSSSPSWRASGAR